MPVCFKQLGTEGQVNSLQKMGWAVTKVLLVHDLDIHRVSILENVFVSQLLSLLASQEVTGRKFTQVAIKCCPHAHLHKF